MKTLRFIPTMLVLIISGIYTVAAGQGQIISVAPGSVYPGQSGDIIIRGLGTNFKPGISKVDLGPNITVNNVTVQTAETIDAYVNVSKTAGSGYVDVKVTTGSEVVTSPNGLQIFQTGGNVTATLIVTPVQSLHLSDFDPSNLAKSPLLFTVTVFNDNSKRNLTAKLTVLGQSAGEIGTATKRLKNTSPNAVVTFDNRQFDKYQVANTNNPAIQKAIQTGVLPSDFYTYKLSVTDDATGQEVANAEGTNVITTVYNKPELIGPGNPFYSDPVAVKTRQPLFQWFSQGNSYDFYLFEVKPGQKSAAEVALNRPLYKSTDPIYASNMIYPQSAPLLEDGKVYAWQIVANYNGTTGNTTLASDLFWFTMATNSGVSAQKTVADIKVNPSEITLNTGQTYKFSVKAYDLNNDTITVNPTWSVVPSDAGTIDVNGNFTASNTPNHAAVIATYNDFKDYSTVDINAGAGAMSSDWDMNMFIKQLFGLPAK